MRNTGYLFLFTTLLLVTSCENFDLFSGSDENNNAGTFSLIINDTLIYDTESIDFYDISTHLIYLKEGYTLDCPESGTFGVYADDAEIYSGRISHPWVCMLPIGPVIDCPPIFYNDYNIQIEFGNFIDSTGHPLPDPRNDPRIIESLEDDGLYRAGLSCEILDVEKLNPNKICLSLELTNNEDGDILILDPDKMGSGLFNYFTNGLYLTDSEGNISTHHQGVIQPEPYDSWEAGWLTKIRGGKKHTIEITYNQFDTMADGEYLAYFVFPGLSSGVDRDDLQQGGRIWLGRLEVRDTVYLGN